MIVIRNSTLVFVLTVTAGLQCVSRLAADEMNSAAFDEVAVPFLERFCVSCHGADTQEALTRFDDIDQFRAEQQYFWVKVYRKLSQHEMPPADAVQPSEKQRQQILDWLRQQSTEVRAASGSARLRRLNRRELAYALQDLTGRSVDYSDSLAGDGKVGGFDTGIDGLQDSADSVAQTLTVARQAVEGIRFLDPPPELVVRRDLRAIKDPRKAFDEWKEQGVNAKLRGVVLPEAGLLIEPKWVGERGGLDFTLPVPTDRRGVLRLKLTVSVVKPMKGIPNPNLWVEIGSQDLDYVEISNPPSDPRELIYEVQLENVAIGSEGVRISLSNKVETPYSISGFENEDRTKPEDKIPGGGGLFRPKYDRKKTPWDQQPVPFIALRSIEIVPDDRAQWPLATWRSELGSIEDNEQSADSLLKLWLTRAWRRPVTEAEQQRYRKFYRQLRQDGHSFDAALRAVFQSVLMSSSFRYLPGAEASTEDFVQYATASRLSFLLWCRPPDDELLNLAAAGNLHDPSVLDQQVDRLLADPRSDAFIRAFTEQWLEMDQPITIVMDYFQLQDFRFARHLKESMRRETFVYVARLFRENRTARELIDSDWTLMNRILAHHYGYDGIEGGELQTVRIRPEDHRGGILGHAGIQSMLCWMGENWVIYRGAWLLRNLLNDPPPPPPLEVPELIPSDNANRGKSPKELLHQHQADARCAVCHRKMDPLGFALQNFDLSGRWRDVEYEQYERNELDGKIEWRGKGASRPVDAAGVLPNGEEFHTFGEFKRLLIQNYEEDVVQGLLEKLFLYSTGRRVNIEELMEIRSITDTAKNNTYRMRDLLKSVVRSKAFHGPNDPH